MGSQQSFSSRVSLSVVSHKLADGLRATRLERERALLMVAAYSFAWIFSASKAKRMVVRAPCSPSFSAAARNSGYILSRS